MVDKIELTEVFREHNNAMEEIDPILSQHSPPKEYSCKLCVLWEDIRGLASYPYEDDWSKYPGEKYHLYLANEMMPRLILGDYRKIKEEWMRR